MKKFITCAIALLAVIHFALAQQKAELPVLLRYPDDWRFEQISFPLDFAPEIDFKGFEELRFSPGMFDTTAEDYFTYAFAIKIEGEQLVRSEQLKNFLDTYYSGLCKAVAADKGLKIDFDEIRSSLSIIETGKFEATVLFFDSFNDGRALELRMLIDTIIPDGGNHQILHARVSPQPMDHPLWKILQLNWQKNLVNLTR